MQSKQDQLLHTLQLQKMRMRKKSRMRLSLLIQLMMKVRCREMGDSTSKEMTPEELRDFIESMHEGTVVSIEIRVALEDG